MRAWAALDPADPPRRVGRPGRSREEVARARELVREQLDLQGWTAGEGPIARALEGEVPLRLVREVLRELKAERRREVGQAERARRVSRRVHARDAVWCIDATALGRDVQGDAVQAEVVRDVGPCRAVEVAVGAPASGEEVVAILERARAARGGAPLVLRSDNGAAYRSAPVRAWARRRGVLQLFNLPRTPKHNAEAEHGIGELKREAGVGLRERGARSRRKGGLVDRVDATARLAAARERLDEQRLRRTRGWRTALQADAEMPPWHGLVTRAAFRSAASCAIREAVKGSKSRRARRLAVRRAVFDTLERCGLLTTTRGTSQPNRPQVAGVS